MFHCQWEFATALETLSQYPIYYLTTEEAARCNYKFDHNSWPLSWISLRITLEQILGLSYGQVLQDIITDIQQNNVGQLFDIDYLVCLTIQMNALFYQNSSQRQVFPVLGSSVDYDPSAMVVTDWHGVIRLFAQEQEHNLINDKFKIPRLKPWLPKDKKPVLAAVKEKHPKVSPPSVKSSPKRETSGETSGGEERPQSGAQGRVRR